MYAPLELTGLTKTFQTPSGPFTAVDNVNARIAPGEFACILGHSGCGKSTVLSMIAGLERATLGGVIIDGKEIDGPGPERAVVFQSPCLLPWLTVRQNVRSQGEMSARTLLRLLDKKDGSPRRVILPTELIIRQSTVGGVHLDG